MRIVCSQLYFCYENCDRTNVYTNWFTMIYLKDYVFKFLQSLHTAKLAFLSFFNRRGIAKETFGTFCCDQSRLLQIQLHRF